MNVKTNILDKIFIIMLLSVFFTNGIMKILNFDQTIKWVESYNYPSELVYIGIFVELLAPMLILINLYRNGPGAQKPFFNGRRHRLEAL